jgi:guanine nucleotide-binding protein G(I)/G(S)/G(T) subunit beta-1
MASVAELKEEHAAATASVNSLRERLRQRRETLLDTDCESLFSSSSISAGS